MHGVHQGVDPYNGNVIPLFMQSMSQLGQISGGIWAPPNPPIQFVPQVFNRGQIWTECWPIERIYVVVSQKLLTNSSDMGPGISGRLSCSLALMGGNWAEDFVSIHVHYSRPSNEVFVAYTMYPVFLFRPSIYQAAHEKMVLIT